MTATAEDYSVQISVKHGPNLSVMTNVRGPDFATVAGHWGEGATFGGQIHGNISQFLALEALTEGGLAPEPVFDPQPRYATPAPAPVASNAAVKPCPVSAGRMHRYKTGVSKKSGKPFAGWYCDADVCAVDWVDVN